MSKTPPAETPPLHSKEYLGDGVYVARDNYGALVLTTENGLHATNIIVLEPEVCAALLQYLGVKR